MPSRRGWAALEASVAARRGDTGASVLSIVGLQALLLLVALVSLAILIRSLGLGSDGFYLLLGICVPVVGIFSLTNVRATRAHRAGLEGEAQQLALIREALVLARSRSAPRGPATEPLVEDDDRAATFGSARPPR